MPLGLKIIRRWRKSRNTVLFQKVHFLWKASHQRTGQKTWGSRKIPSFLRIFIPSQHTGNIFRSRETLVLRHPLCRAEFTSRFWAVKRTFNRMFLNRWRSTVMCCMMQHQCKKTSVMYLPLTTTAAVDHHLAVAATVLYVPNVMINRSFSCFHPPA